MEEEEEEETEEEEEETEQMDLEEQPSRFQGHFRPRRYCASILRGGLCWRGSSCTFAHSYGRAPPGALYRDISDGLSSSSPSCSFL